MLQNATPLRKSAPWPNISDEHVSCTAPATRNACFQILFKCPTPAIVLETATKKPSRFAHFWQGAQSPSPATQNDIWTSKSAPCPSVFCAFDFEMCFAPQRRALFRHLNFQKCSEPVSFLHFWLRNVLRTTTACNFSSLIWPNGSAPAALASLLFDPPEPQIIEKTQCFATFLPFRTPGSSFFGDFLFLIFFLLLFSSLTLPISAFHLSILSEVWLLNFLRLISTMMVMIAMLNGWNGDIYSNILDCWSGRWAQISTWNTDNIVPWISINVHKSDPQIISINHIYPWTCHI